MLVVFIVDNFLYDLAQLRWHDHGLFETHYSLYCVCCKGNYDEFDSRVKQRKKKLWKKCGKSLWLEKKEVQNEISSDREKKKITHINPSSASASSTFSSQPIILKMNQNNEWKQKTKKKYFAKRT